MVKHTRSSRSAPPETKILRWCEESGGSYLQSEADPTPLSPLSPPENRVLADLHWFNFLTRCCEVQVYSRTLWHHCWVWPQVQQTNMIPSRGQWRAAFLPVDSLLAPKPGSVNVSWGGKCTQHVCWASRAHVIITGVEQWRQTLLCLQLHRAPLILSF